MRVIVLNPNTSTAMTSAVVERMRARMPAGVEILGCTAQHGPAVIASRETFDEGARSGVALAAECRGQADAIVLACFGDPGIDSIQALCPVPVIGLAQASIRRAESMQVPWAIVTAGAAWCEMLRERVQSMGATRHFVDVFTIEGTGLDAMRDPALGRARLHSAVCKARQAGARSIILGGAALAGMAEAMAESEATLLDCVDCAADAAVAALK